MKKVIVTVKFVLEDLNGKPIANQESLKFQIPGVDGNSLHSAAAVNLLAHRQIDKAIFFRHIQGDKLHSSKAPASWVNIKELTYVEVDDKQQVSPPIHVETLSLRETALVFRLLYFKQSRENAISKYDKKPPR